MESLFYRYRNIIVLLLVMCAQIVLLAWQVKSDSDVPMVRVWAVTAVTPVASAIEFMRNGTTGLFSSYFELRNAREQSRKLRTEVDQLRLQNQLLKNELASAQRAESLAGFQARSLSKMIGARVVGATPGVGTTSVIIDRGSTSGIHRGMAVVTPDGIVGKVVSVFPLASQVLSVTDPGFSAGVESQKNHVHGVLKGLGNGSTRVDYVPTGQKVEVGEMFYTSGEDRIFPKGLAVGRVTGVHEGGNFQDITVQPAGTETAPEEVLVIVDPVHQAIPEEAPAETPVFLAPDVSQADHAAQPGSALTTADKLREQYQKIGAAQKHVFGEGGPGTPPPNFNLKVPGVNAPAATGSTGIAGATGKSGVTGKSASAEKPSTVLPPPGATGGSGSVVKTPAAPPVRIQAAGTGSTGATGKPRVVLPPAGATGSSGSVLKIPAAPPARIQAAGTGSTGDSGKPRVILPPSGPTGSPGAIPKPPLAVPQP